MIKPTKRYIKTKDGAIEMKNQYYLMREKFNEISSVRARYYLNKLKSTSKSGILFFYKNSIKISSIK